jgi:hypothetical protein
VAVESHELMVLSTLLASKTDVTQPRLKVTVPELMTDTALAFTTETKCEMPLPMDMDAAAATETILPPRRVVLTVVAIGCATVFPARLTIEALLPDVIDTLLEADLIAVTTDAHATATVFDALLTLDTTVVHATVTACPTTTGPDALDA